MPTPRIPSDHPHTPQQFFAREAETWALLIANCRGLPEEVLLKPGACGPAWSIKDMMNHVAVWQETAARVIRNLLAGQWGQLGSNTEKFNAKQYEADKARSLTATRRRLNRSRRDLLAILATVPAKKLLNIYGRQQIGWWAKYSTYGHYSEHIAALQMFRQRFTASIEGVSHAC